MSGSEKRAFAPVVDERTRLVVLGSLPGEMSLAHRQYYANPSNQFWRLIGRVIERDLVAMGYDEKLAALLEARIGLWDVIETADRKGSLDGAIRNAQARSLAEFADSLPELRALAFNGRTAASIGRRQLGQPLRHTVLELPSSSAAYCTINLEQKAHAWLALATFLGDR